MGHFHENAAFKVDAALRRGGGPGQTNRRSEIGSHAPPPKTSIFIDRGELEEFMGHFYENAKFGNHSDCFLHRNSSLSTL